MGLSNAERQKRHRDKLKERLRNGSTGGLRSLPAVIADLPRLDDDPDNSPQTIAERIASEMMPAAMELVELLLDDNPVQAREIAAIFGIDPDPVRGLTERQFHDAIKAASIPKAELRRLLGRRAETLANAIMPYDFPVRLQTAHSYRPLLERLGLWAVT
jgi:hypothetical protein